jgi:hypothetical protein
MQNRSARRPPLDLLLALPLAFSEALLLAFLGTGVEGLVNRHFLHGFLHRTFLLP